MSTTTLKAGTLIEEDKPLKINGKAVSHKVYKSAVLDHSTFETLWVLIGKHKVALLAVGNIVLVLNWAFPAWPELLKSII